MKIAELHTILWTHMDSYAFIESHHPYLEKLLEEWNKKYEEEIKRGDVPDIFDFNCGIVFDMGFSKLIVLSYCTDEVDLFDAMDEEPDHHGYITIKIFEEDVQPFDVEYYVVSDVVNEVSYYVDLMRDDGAVQKGMKVKVKDITFDIWEMFEDDFIDYGMKVSRNV